MGDKDFGALMVGGQAVSVNNDIVAWPTNLTNGEHACTGWFINSDPQIVRLINYCWGSLGEIKNLWCS